MVGGLDNACNGTFRFLHMEGKTSRQEHELPSDLMGRASEARSNGARYRALMLSLACLPACQVDQASSGAKSDRKPDARQESYDVSARSKVVCCLWREGRSLIAVHCGRSSTSTSWDPANTTLCNLEDFSYVENVV